MGKVSLHIQNYNVSERKQRDKSKCESPMALKTHTANRVKKRTRLTASAVVLNDTLSESVVLDHHSNNL